MRNRTHALFLNAPRIANASGAINVLAVLLATGFLPLSSVLASELVDFYSPTGPYLDPVFLSADGETAVGGLTGNTGTAQIGRLSGRTFEIIGSPDGGDTYARGLSDDGKTIVGFSKIIPSGTSYAFRWNNGVMTNLGTFGGTYAEAVAVSADGSVVAGSAGTPNNAAMAFRWEGGTLQALGTLGGADSFARAVSADGTSVVGVSSLANRNLHAFLWQAGAITDLGTLGGDHSTPTAINADGQVVVGNSLLAGNSVSHAFRWSAGTMQDLGTLGGYYSDAQFVSADGSVVVGNSILANNVNMRAFRWQAGAMVDLGSLGGSSVYASDMNPAGTVVVGKASDTSNQDQAFRWSLAGGMQTVDAWLADNGVPFSSAGKNAVTASGVSDDGSVIIGQLSNGHRYLARVVAPASPSLPPLVVTPPVVVTPPLVVTPPVVLTPPVTSLLPTVVTDPVSTVPATAAPTQSGALPTPVVSAPGSGLIDVDDFMAGLSGVRAQTSAIALNTGDLTLNGLHGNPMRGLLPVGKQSVWASGDIARNGHNAAGSDLGLGEIGYSANLMQGWQVNLALGHTADTQKGPGGNRTRVQSTYVLPELIVQLPNTPAYTTFSLLYSRGDSDIERGYLNAGIERSSQGDPSVTGLGARVRLDLLNAFSLGGASFTPYVSHTVLDTRLNGYTETGGGFPVAWSPSSMRSQTSRLGLDAVKPLTPRVTLLGRIEGARRYEAQSPRAEGKLLGAGGGRFSLPGRDYKQNWLRAGTGAEIKAGAGIASLVFNATTEGENPSYWVTVGYQLQF